MKTHLRIVIRQPANAPKGAIGIVLNDGVEVVDSETGAVVGDLSRYVRRIEIVGAVTEPRIVRLEIFAGEIAAETEPPRETPQVRTYTKEDG